MQFSVCYFVGETYSRYFYDRKPLAAPIALQHSIGYSKKNLKIHTGSPPSLLSLPYPPSPSAPPLPSPPTLPPIPSYIPLPLEVGPLKSCYGVWGSAVSSPQRGLGRSLSRDRF